MNLISVNYTLIWQFKYYPHFKVSKCRKIFNIKTGKQKKITVNGGSIGVWVTPKKFIVKSEFKKHIEKITAKEYCPF